LKKKQITALLGRGEFVIGEHWGEKREGTGDLFWVPKSFYKGDACKKKETHDG